MTIRARAFWMSPLLFAACSLPALAQGKSTIASAEGMIDAEKIRAQVRFLADDLTEGRYPGTRGSDLSAKYIATQFALDGLEPAGDNGSYLQQINFVGMTAKPGETTFSFVPQAGARACRCGLATTLWCRTRRWERRRTSTRLWCLWGTG